MSDFNNKTAIITGSATGLGAEVALRLAREGARVVINYSKSQKEAEETAKKCEAAAAGAEVEVVQADVADDSACRVLVEKTLARFGGVDILVNNAGTTKFANHSDLDALSADDFAHIYKVNVIAPFQMIRAVAPTMKANYSKDKSYGSVVNISSIAGVLATGSSVAYCASKAALNNMTRSLARALAPAIRVNAVCPGFIGTRWFSDRFGDEMFEQIKTQMEQTMPLAQAGTPELVADAVLFFCGSGARNITGETLLSDSGMHLNNEAG